MGRITVAKLRELYPGESDTEHQAMKRPERIPQDIWQNLTVREAVDADMLGEAALEMAEPETLCRELQSDSVLAKCLRQNVDVNHNNKHPNADEILDRRIRRIRQMRDDANKGRPKRIPQDIWQDMTVREAHVHGFFPRPSDGADLPQDYLLRSFPSDSHIITLLRNKLQRIDDQSLDRRFFVIRAERVINGLSIRGAKAEQAIVDDDPYEQALTLALARELQDIRPNASAPVLSPKFREDICRNDGPLLPPFEAGEPTDRVTVMMLYAYAGREQSTVRCAILPDGSMQHSVEFSINANDPNGYAIRWYSFNRNTAWRDIARTALRFDLAVRTGEPLAVSAYGLILFALAVGAERERKRARAAMSDADEAMDAVFRAAREVSEGE